MLRSLSMSRLPLLKLPLQTTSSLRLLNLLTKPATSLCTSPSRNVTLKQNINFLKGLACCLGISEESVERHGDTECSEDHVRLPLDIGERWWDKEGECQVEAVSSPVSTYDWSGSGGNDLHPVTRGSEANTLSSVL